MGFMSNLKAVSASLTNVIVGVAELADGTINIAKDVQQVGKNTSELFVTKSNISKQAEVIKTEILEQMRVDAAEQLKAAMQQAQSAEERAEAWATFKSVEAEINSIIETE